jgi:hypothetical protein
MSDRQGVERRIDSYFSAIVTMARRGAVAGKAGSWSGVGARAEKASRDWHATQACHPALHAHFLEFKLWGEILAECVLPDRQRMLAAALHRIGREEARDDLADVEALLGVVCPEEHATPPSARDWQKPSLDELAVLAQLRDAERRGTVSALDSAFRATVFLAERLGEDKGASHPKCEAWSVLTVSWILTRALWETMPDAHRSMLARIAQLEYYRRYAPDERKPDFFQETPALHIPRGADPRWAFCPAWQFVPNTQRGEDPLNPGPEPWLLEDMELSVRQDIHASIRRKQELEQRLALLASRRSAH